jgi:hypothetical protein
MEKLTLAALVTAREAWSSDLEMPITVVFPVEDEDVEQSSYQVDVGYMAKIGNETCFPCQFSDDDADPEMFILHHDGAENGFMAKGEKVTVFLRDRV